MKYLLLSFLFITSAHAVFPTVHVENVSGDYLDEKGTAYAEKAYYVLPKVKISHSDINIKINKKSKHLIINDPNTTVELVFDFSFLNVFKAFDFDNMNIKSNGKLFTLTSGNLGLHIDPKRYVFEELAFETDVRNIPTQDDEDITVIDGLILNAALSVKRLQFKQLDKMFFVSLKNENERFVDEVEKLTQKSMTSTVPMVVRFIRFNVKEGIFSGRAKIDSYINLWLKVSGVISTNKENTMLDINLKRAKLGIFSVRGTLLRLVRNLKMDNVTVNGSHIIVDLNSIVLGGRRGSTKL